MDNIDVIVDLLDHDECLAIGRSPWDPEIDHNGSEIWQTKWGALFPDKSFIDRGSEYDWEIYGDDWDLDLEELDQIFNRPDDPGMEKPEAWDVAAWYQPIHFSGFDWGIYIKEEAILTLAAKLYRETGHLAYSLTSPQKQLFAKGLIRTAFSIYYHHELYHHKTECLGFRIHAIQRRSSYLHYFDNVYRATAGTDHQIEEALANAFMYREFGRHTWIPRSLKSVACSYLSHVFSSYPPSYRLAPNYLSKKNFDAGQKTFFSQVLEGSLIPSHSSAYWAMAPRANHAISNITGDIWTVVPCGKKPLIPTTATPFKTCSSDQMVKVCNQHGYSLVPGGKGSHIKMKKPGSPTIIIPGNRDNVSPGAAKNILLSLGYKVSQLPDLL